MKSTLLCAAALAVLATPAAARDNSTYFGLEVGGLLVDDTEVEVDDEEFATIDHKLGVDGDMVLGHDFGMFRLETELGYKRSEHRDYDIVDDDDIDGEGRTSAYSLMLNGMVDVGDERDINFYAGAGAGFAQVIHVLEEDEEEDDDGLKIKDRGFAWQLFAGIRKQLDRHFDVGLKYRYFDGGNVNDDVDEVEVSTDYTSHSLLFSLIHNFNVEPAYVPPPAPPLPPVPPPAAPPPTQTCPDGTVVLATDPCPMPPPPPPPPPPMPERG